MALVTWVDEVFEFNTEAFIESMKEVRADLAYFRDEESDYHTIKIIEERYGVTFEEEDWQ